MRKMFVSGESVIATLLVMVWFVVELWFVPPVFADTIISNCQNSTQPYCGNKVIQVDTAGMTGYIGGLAGDIAAISTMGSVAGLSGAGITSGLAAIGGLVGGGMVAGVVLTVAAPAVVAVGASVAASYLLNQSHDQQGQTE